MATGILRILATVTGLAEGDQTIGPLELQATSAVGERRSPLTLASGNNTIAVPATATVALLIPPVGNAQTLTLKGASGDTGVALHKTFPTPIALEAGANANLIIAAGATVNGFVVVFI